MKITKRQLKRIIKEERAKMLKEYTSDADAAYEAGHDDAIRNRPHGSNPDMRDLDPSAYDHGFDKGTAERMDMQRPCLMILFSCLFVIFMIVYPCV